MKKIIFIASFFLSMSLYAKTHENTFLYTFEPGHHYLYHLHVDSTISYDQHPNSQKIPFLSQKTSLDICYQYVIKEVYAQNNALIEMTLFSIDHSIDNHPPSSQLEKFFSSLINIPFYFHMDNHGQCKEHQDFNDLLSHTLDKEKFPLPLEDIHDIFSPFTLSPSPHLCPQLSERPLKPQEEWTTEEQFDIPFPGTLTNHFKLKSLQNDQATITIDSSFITPLTNIPDTPDFFLQAQCQGNIKGFIIIDTTSGWPLSSTIKQELKGSATLNTPLLSSSHQPTDLTFPFTMTSSITLSSWTELK